jgi:hypothetical protein
LVDFLARTASDIDNESIFTHFHCQAPPALI